MFAPLLLLLLAPEPGPVERAEATLRKYAHLPEEQGRREEAIRALGALGTPESTRVLEALLEDPYAHLRDEAACALAQLRRRAASERAPSLVFLGESLNRRREAETRIHLARALGLVGDASAVPALAQALDREREGGVATAIALALSRLADPRGLAALQENARRHPAACIEAAASFPDTAEWALAFWEGGDDAVRAAIVDALSRRHRDVFPDLDHLERTGERTGIALCESLAGLRDRALARRRAGDLLAHPSWRVRAAAIAAVAALRDPALLPDLVDRLEAEEGLLRQDAWDALRRLTGREIGPDPARWRAVLPLADLSGGPGAREAGKDPSARSTYFGLPVVSRRIAFVFDVSGPMRGADRLDAARARFAEAAAGLTEEQRYDLFVTRVPLEDPPRPRLERAFGRLAAGKAREAVAWLGKQDAQGGDADFDTLIAALGDDEVDTVYLASDGVPGFGSVRRPDRILEEIGRRNRFRRVVIHAILLCGGDADRAFLKDLAALTGGSAVDAEGRPLG